MLYLLFSISAVIVFVLLETDALAEYAQKLRIPLPYLKEFMEYRKSASGIIHYIDFVCLKKDSFFTRFIGCAVCLLLGLNIIVHLLVIPKYGWLSFIFFFFNTLAGWIVYFILRILSRLADEQPAQK